MMRFKCPDHLCDKLLNLFKTTPESEKVKGRFMGGNVDPAIKKSTDFYMKEGAEETVEYQSFIINCLKAYSDRFNIYNSFFASHLYELFNLQKYEPNEGYFAAHTERSNLAVHRELTFMTYLNTLTSPKYEGGTEWLFYNLKVKPVKGDTYVWPAFFTHTHRGIVHPTETKYILTGWAHLDKDAAFS
jgi:hypothetical protein